MEDENTDKFIEEKNSNKIPNFNIYNSSKLRLGGSQDNILYRNNNNNKFSSYNIISENNKYRLNFEKYNNIVPVNRTSQNIIGYNCLVNCVNNFCPYDNYCNFHHIHFHHIHIPHNHICPHLNKSLSVRRIGHLQLNKDLLNEISELRNECRKFKDELENAKTENKKGNEYRKLLENKIRAKEKNNIKINDNFLSFEEPENTFFERKKQKKIEHKYQNMLNKSFDVLFSVSNKCDNKNGRMKGGLNYYIDKDPDYDELIEAQKKWLDNLPDKNCITKNGDTLNFNNNSISLNSYRTGSKEGFNDENIHINNNSDYLNNNSNYNKKYYNNISNFNKIGENSFNRNNQNIPYNLYKISNYINQNKQNFENKYNQGNINYINKNNNIKNPNQLDQNLNLAKNQNKNNINHNINEDFNNSENRYISKKVNQSNYNNRNIPFFENHKINDNKKPSLNANDINILNNYQLDGHYRKLGINYNQNPENQIYNFINAYNNTEEEYDQREALNNHNQIINNNEIKIIPNNNINENQREEINPLNERFIIVDENGNPIIVEGKKLLGMELIPFIGEDGKEVLDNNGNLILIGPDGKPKTQDELEPILLDDDKPLVNEENKPFLGINGVPLINRFGNPILGPGELYDKNNQVVMGNLGLLVKDDMGNPIKVMLNKSDDELKNESFDENNNSEEKESNLNTNKNDINYNINNDSNINSNNNIKFNHNNDGGSNEDNNDNYYNLKNLIPLIGSNGKPVKDEQNNYILLDNNNRPVKNTGLTLLLDQKGKPVLNSKKNPILIDIEGKPINLEYNFNNDDNSINSNHLPKKIKQDQKKKYKNNIPIVNQPINIDQDFNQISNNDKNRINKGYIKLDKKPKIFDKNKFNKNKNNKIHNLHNYKDIIFRNKMNKRDKGKFNYSEIKHEKIKNINYMKYNKYKGTCFACDIGCSVSSSGYSPMNYSPYNNLIRRREVTPIINRERQDYDNINNIRVNKTQFENDNNYY